MWGNLSTYFFLKSVVLNKIVNQAHLAPVYLRHVTPRAAKIDLIMIFNCDIWCYCTIDCVIINYMYIGIHHLSHHRQLFLSHLSDLIDTLSELGLAQWQDCSFLWGKSWVRVLGERLNFLFHIVTTGYWWLCPLSLRARPGVSKYKANRLKALFKRNLIGPIWTLICCMRLRHLCKLHSVHSLGL